MQWNCFCSVSIGLYILLFVLFKSKHTTGYVRCVTNTVNSKRLGCVYKLQIWILLWILINEDILLDTDVEIKIDKLFFTIIQCRHERLPFFQVNLWFIRTIPADLHVKSINGFKIYLWGGVTHMDMIIS